MRSFYVVFGLLAPAFAGAAVVPGPCTGGTLNTYLGNGFTCTIGNLLFSNFTYTQGGTVPITPSAITVNPLKTPVGDEGFDFNPGEAVNSIGHPALISQDVNISFLVSTLDGAFSIDDLFIGFNGSASGSGLADFTEKYCPGQTTTINGSCAGGGTFTVANPGGPVNQVITFAATNMVAIDKDVLVSTQGDCGRASVSDFTNRYSQTLAPEPATLYPLAAGLIGCGFLRRRRTRS